MKTLWFYKYFLDQPNKLDILSEIASFVLAVPWLWAKLTACFTHSVILDVFAASIVNFVL